jgi:hypothetical protein
MRLFDVVLAGEEGVSLGTIDERGRVVDADGPELVTVMKRLRERPVVSFSQGVKSDVMLTDAVQMVSLTDSLHDLEARLFEEGMLMVEVEE